MAQKAVSVQETEWLLGLKNQDRQICALVYKAYFPMILHFIISNQGTEQEAKDVYQQAFIHLYEQSQKPDFILSCKLKTYLYAVCRRIWLRQLFYKGRFSGKILDYESVISLDDQLMQDADDDQVRYNAMNKGMESLGEPCKTILMDFYFNKFNMHQIAEKMGYTNADNAKNQKYKCLARLKKITEKYVNNEKES